MCLNTDIFFYLDLVCIGAVCAKECLLIWTESIEACCDLLFNFCLLTHELKICCLSLFSTTLQSTVFDLMRERERERAEMLCDEVFDSFMKYLVLKSSKLKDDF